MKRSAHPSNYRLGDAVCPACGMPLPDKHIVCLACIEKRALAGAIELAGRHLPNIAGGSLKLRLMRKFKNAGELHIVVPNTNDRLAWCGLDVRDFSGKQDEDQPLDKARVAPNICHMCVLEIDRRIAAAEAAT